MPKKSALKVAADIIDGVQQEGGTDLYLVRLNLDRLPDNLWQLANLQKLSLNINRLTELPESLGQLVHLKELVVGPNRLKTLPDSLTRLTNLVKLSVHENRISALPEGMGQLVNLNWLNVSRNRLDDLPESVGQLINLQNFHCSNNQLTTIPESFAYLANLRMLGLQSNSITALPDIVGDLANLEGLYLDNNPLTTLPESLGKLNRLERLFLRNNEHLTSLPVLQVDELDITNCRNLAALPEGMVIRKKLELGNTALTSLPNSLQNTPLYWYTVPIDMNIAFNPSPFTAQEILSESNVNRRRGMYGWCSNIQSFSKVPGIGLSGPCHD